MKKLLIIVALLAGISQAQTTTTITGTLKDLTNALVTSGKVTFTLQPSKDTTISGIARFSPQQVVCLISGAGLIVAQDGSSPCVITMNTSLQPPGSYWRVDVWPYNVKTSSFTFYSVLSSYDWSTVVPTPTTSPAQNFVDVFSNQTIAGNKLFTGDNSHSGAESHSGNETHTGNETHSGSELFKSLNSVLYADQFIGASSDIGQAVNAAYAALPSSGGRIRIRAGTWPIATPIACSTAAKPCLIEGDPAGATTLTYAATSGTAITLNWGAAHQYGGGLRDITLTGACATTACTANTSVGVVILNEGGYYENVSVGKIGAGFFTGVSFNTTGFIDSWVNPAIYGNATGILQTGNTENLHFYGGSISANAVAVSITANGDFFFDKVSFDDNTSSTGQIAISGSSGITVGFTDCHWENPSLGSSQYFNITAPANVYLRGGNLNDDRASSTQAQMITANGANYLAVDGTNIYSAGITVTQLVNATSIGQGLYLKTMNNFPSRVLADVNSGYTGSLYDLALSPATPLFAIPGVTKYKGVATAGQGMTPVYAVTQQKAETAADTNVLTLTPPAAAGTYRISFTLSLSAANAATLGWTATWKDANGNAQTPTNLSLVQSGAAAPALTFTTSAAGNYYGQAIVDVDNSATAIVIKMTFSGTSFAGKASATIERVQ